VLLEEAGGRLTDLRGVPGFAGGDGLASNGHLHDAALRVLQSTT
jgi:histidinol-phosphatase